MLEVGGAREGWYHCSDRLRRQSYHLPKGHQRGSRLLLHKKCPGGYQWISSIGVYGNSDSKLIGTYEYDLWGKHVSVKEASAGVDTDGILLKNPLRYRGYYYDEETGFYYLNARYYGPEVRRFISADDVSYLGADETVTGYNLFSYCGNNPIIRMDPFGQFWQELWDTFVQTLQQANGCLVVAAGTTQIDSPAPGPGDVVGAAIAIGVVLICAGIAVNTVLTESLTNTTSKTETKAKVCVTTKESDNPLIFPVNPNDLNPIGLIKVHRAGTKNGSFISWMDPSMKTEVFRWDENPNFSNGPHYHIYGTGHYIPGVSIIPEPYASIYFPYE